MTSMDFPSVTAIVCTRDRPLLLEACLRSLSRQTYPRFEVLVVDNAPTLPARDICARWGAKWILAPMIGVARARNAGARCAQGEIIAYIDDDAVAEPGWLEAIVDDFKDPQIGGVSGGIRYMKAQGDSRAMSDEEAANLERKPHLTFDSGTSDWFTRACFGGVSEGGNMAFRRDLIAFLAPFDERLGRGRPVDSGEEHVAFATLISHGYKIAHNPAAVWRHPSPPTAELQRARRFYDLRSSISYLLFVWCEFPPHRLEILRFLLRAVRKRLVPGIAGSSAAVRLPLWRFLHGVFGGIADHRRARANRDSCRAPIVEAPIAAAGKLSGRS